MLTWTGQARSFGRDVPNLYNKKQPAKIYFQPAAFLGCPDEGLQSLLNLDNGVCLHDVADLNAIVALDIQTAVKS